MHNIITATRNSLVALVVFGFACELSASTIYLATNGDDANDGSDWSLAKKTVNAAFAVAAAASDPATILVAPGTYTATATMTLDNEIVIRGVTDNPEDCVFVVGTGVERMFYLNNAAAKIEGVVLEGGSGKGTTEALGHGRNTYVAAGVISNCVVRNARLSNVTASKNCSTTVYLTGTGSLMSHCVVTNNIVSGTGWSTSGKYCSPGVVLAGGARIEYTLVADNFDESDRENNIEAAGVTLIKGTMDHCTVIGNSGPSAGGVHMTKDSIVTNSIIAANRSFYKGANYDDVTPDMGKYIKDTIITPKEACRYLADVANRDYRTAPGTAAEDKGYVQVPSATFTADKIEAFIGEDVELFIGGASVVTQSYATAGWKDVAVGNETKRRFLHVVPRDVIVSGSNGAVIQEAVDEAIDGQTIRIAPGTYVVSDRIVVKKGIRLEGSSGNPEDVVIASNANATRAIELHHVDSSVANVTLDGANASSTGYDKGRLLWIDGAGGTCSNCVIRNFEAKSVTAANRYSYPIWLRSASALLTHATITNNHSACSTTSPSVNVLALGFYAINTPKVENCLIADNIDSGTRTKNAYAIVYGNPIMRNCTIVGNMASDCAVRLTSGGSMVDCVVAGNASTSLGVDNIHTNQSSKVVNCVTSDNAPYNANCVNAPFNALFKDTVNHDYHPIAAAALVNTGSGTAAQLPATDLDGNARLQGSAVDIGCYELDTTRFELSFSSAETSYLIPVVVEFTASVAGSDPGDDVKYYWDFNGDGITDEVTVSATASNSYTACGFETVGLSVTNFTKNISATSVKENYLSFMPPVIYFDPSVGDACAWPYDTWANAATNLQEAVDASNDGLTIYVAPGRYSCPSEVDVQKSIRILGVTGNPEDVVFTAAPDNQRAFHFSAKGSMLANCVFEGCANRTKAGLVFVEGLGGTISNVVARNICLTGLNRSGLWYLPFYLEGANSLATHCVVTGNESKVTSGSTTSGTHSFGFHLSKGARLENSLIAFNAYTGTGHGSDSVFGGAVHGGVGSVVNCTIVSNTFWNTGAVMLDSGSRIVNTVVAGNIARTTNVTDEPGWNIRQNSVYTSDHNLIGGDLTGYFRDYATLDFVPRSTGPLINKGSLDGVNCPLRDLSGGIRVRGKTIDIGAYEGFLPTTVISVK